ncbi:hypothetical protein [Chitinimonas sp.]|uniref:hypothetical protein n=1 Tax=Chitinimonas sp. TaxID=1934313 RepID=UPI002F922803
MTKRPMLAALLGLGLLTMPAQAFTLTVSQQDKVVARVELPRSSAKVDVKGDKVKCSHDKQSGMMHCQGVVTAHLSADGVSMDVSGDELVFGEGDASSKPAPATTGNDMQR